MCNHKVAGANAQLQLTKCTACGSKINLDGVDPELVTAVMLRTLHEVCAQGALEAMG